MILGNTDKFNGDGLVGFLDILGFSREIKFKWGSEVDNPLDKILTLKENLAKHTNTALEVEGEKSLTGRMYFCRVQTISDSIVVSFGFDANPDPGDLIFGTLHFFDTISVIWRNCLEVGFTIRGAGAFGPIYWNEKEIVGPSFIEAYELEKTHAKTSRVILSSSLNQRLANMHKEAKTMWNDMMLKTLTKDIDGFISLNPHNLYSNNIDKQYIIGLLTKMRDGTDGLNREKYTPLLACLSTQKNGLVGGDLGKY
jgi:hypothetical protein